MKKLIILLTSMLILGGIPLRAQTPMALPYGSFEQWTTHQGYSVSVLFLQVPIYDAFSTPTGWNYPSYPINQTVSLMGMNININTSVPLILANAETASVPAGTNHRPRNRGERPPLPAHHPHLRCQIPLGV